MAKSKKKYYVVWVGKNPGIYDNWKDCQEQIKSFPNAKYKSFPNGEEATLAFRGSYDQYYEKKAKKQKVDLSKFRDEIKWDSISVDAACSGNPGLMEYRGVETKSGKQLFHKGPFEDGTNNIGEFLALVHALAAFNKAGKTKQSIYTDSRTAMSWVKNKKVKTKLKPSVRNKIIFELLQRAETWLRENSWDHSILKWDTERWGEIPADFGRK